jgi:hypothetical protein
MILLQHENLSIEDWEGDIYMFDNNWVNPEVSDEGPVDFTILHWDSERGKTYDEVSFWSTYGGSGEVHIQNKEEALIYMLEIINNSYKTNYTIKDLLSNV